MNLKILTVLCGALVLAGMAPEALAEYEIKNMTPEIESAFGGRQARYARLQALKAEGSAGENNRGYVEALRPGGEVTAVVKDENADRRTIYQAIATQNQLGPQGLATVETVFAEVQRDKARPDDTIQLPSGEWVKK
jgi:uncharacterized protein YdbL (DUF1318 family)